MLNRNPKARSLANICSQLFLFSLALSTFFPPVRLLPFYNQLWMISMLGWFMFTALANPNYIFKPSIFTISVYIYITYTISIAYLTKNPSIGNRFFQLAQLPLFYMAYQSNKTGGRDRYNLLIVAGITPFILITNYLTIKATNFDLTSEVSRSIIANRNVGIGLIKEGVGGYEFIYFLVILFLILINVLFNKVHPLKRSNNIIGTFILIFLAVSIVLSNYSIALLLLILITILRIIIPLLIGRNKILITLFIIIILFFLTQIFYGFLTYLINVLAGSTNASHFLEIRDFFFSGQIGDSLLSRFEKVNISVKAFISNPILGLLTAPLGTSSSYIEGFGKHSQILDTFALYGLGIGLLQLFIYIQPIAKRMKNINGSSSLLSLSILIITCMLFTLNNATPSIGFAAFFIYPTAYDWLQNDN